MEQGGNVGRNQYERAYYQCDNEKRYCTAIRSIDTVRALHQTVVSLRGALDESRQEIDKLRKQIVINNEIQDSRPCQHQTIKQVDQTAPHLINCKTLGEKVTELEKIYHNSKKGSKSDLRVTFPEELECSTSPKTSKKTHKIQSSVKNDSRQTISVSPDIRVTTNGVTTEFGSTGSLNQNMASSRIDVKIKVLSKINMDNDESSETSESVTQEGDKEEVEVEIDGAQNNPKVEVEMFEDSNSNTFDVSSKNVTIKVTSDDNINIIKQPREICIQQSSSEYLNLDIDDMSEGDNSVFTEGATTPIGERLQQMEDVETDNEGLDGMELPRDEKEEKDDVIEEVDDIEVIFSSDDNKDIIQEDLVSISEYEPWQEDDGLGTPILMKFSTLTSEDRDREAYYEKKKALKAQKIAKAKEKSLSMESQPMRSLESTDSLSFDFNRSMDCKSSSIDKDSSLENPISRDVSFDTFKQAASGAGPLNRKWTNHNVLIETDISKIGIGENDSMDMGRRNTCPNPPIYRPTRSSFRNPLNAKFPRRSFCPVTILKTPQIATTAEETTNDKCTSAVQTDISALPHQWRSETHLIGTEYCASYTLPSRYATPQPTSVSRGRNALNRLSDKTQEARRILLSDINFTSMVPELSRSADHLCQQRINEEENENAENGDYYKGCNLKTPDYTSRGITPSFSMTASPGVSQWTVNESTTQTEGFWCERGDSFDSTKSYSMRSELSKHHRSRSVPSNRCAISPPQKVRGSLPDLRHDCTCPRRYAGGQSSLYRMHESSGSTDSLLEEADEFLRHCAEDQSILELNTSKRTNRRCSEADIQRDYHPSKQSLPFLPRSPKCLKPGQLAKVIAKNGRVIVGRIRYVGPVASVENEDCFVGLQFPNNLGDCDGSINEKQFFKCEPNFGLFVPFKKVIMAWNS
ncbi:unnamed protein product [Diamesa serratosioi]